MVPIRKIKLSLLGCRIFHKVNGRGYIYIYIIYKSWVKVWQTIWSEKTRRWILQRWIGTRWMRESDPYAGYQELGHTQERPMIEVLDDVSSICLRIVVQVQSYRRCCCTALWVPTCRCIVRRDLFPVIVSRYLSDWHSQLPFGWKVVIEWTCYTGLRFVMTLLP